MSQGLALSLPLPNCVIFKLNIFYFIILKNIFFCNSIFQTSVLKDTSFLNFISMGVGLNRLVANFYTHSHIYFIGSILSLSIISLSILVTD